MGVIPEDGTSRESGVCEKNGVGDDDELRSNPPAPPGLNLISDVYEGARVQKKTVFRVQSFSAASEKIQTGGTGT